MQVEVENISSVQCKLSVTLPAAQVDEAYNAIVREIAKAANIPGFRKGKVPRGVIEAHYGPKIQEDVVNRLVSDSLPKAIADKEIAAVATSHFHHGDLKKGADYNYTVDVDVQPTIELAKYTGLDVPPFDVEVTDEDIDADLLLMQQNAAQPVPVLDRDIVSEGDVVTVDYVGAMGGIPFAGGSAENAAIEVGAGGYIPGFAEGLMGAKVPSERDVEVTFPEDYNSKDLAGKPATFKMTVKELKKKELPALDDEFAKDVGEDDLNALRAKISGQKKAEKEQLAEREKHKATLKALIDANPFELPQSMINDQAERVVGNSLARLEQMMGKKVSPNDFDIPSLYKGALEDAEFQVRSGLLLAKVAEVAEIKVEDTDIEAEIEKICEQAGDQAEQARAQFFNPENRDRLRYRLIEDKTLQYLYDNATVAKA